MFAFNVIFLVGVFCTIAGVNAENKSKSTHDEVLPYKYVPTGVLQFPPSSHWVLNGNCYEDRATREKSYVMRMAFIVPCNHKPCILVAGQVYNVTTGFIPLKEVSGGHVNVEVLLPNPNPARWWLPYPGFKTLNLCDQLLGGVSCPLKARQEVFFRFSLLLPKGDTLLSILPKLVDLRWIVRDGSGKIIFCSIIEACNSKECIFNQCFPQSRPADSKSVGAKMSRLEKVNRLVEMVLYLFRTSEGAIFFVHVQLKLDLSWFKPV